MIRRVLHLTFKSARRIAVVVVGTTVLALGIVLIVAPGPAIVVIPIGLAILGLEFAWARLWLGRLRKTISEQGTRARAKRAAEHQRRATE